MLNNVTIMGRLVETPELRETKSNSVPVTSFRIACSRDYVNNGERDTDFFEVDAWRQTAEFICKYFEKGQMICIEGRLKNKQWTDKKDQKRTDTVIEVDHAYFCESKKKGDSAQDNYGSPANKIDPFSDEFSSAPAMANNPKPQDSPWG